MNYNPNSQTAPEPVGHDATVKRGTNKRKPQAKPALSTLQQEVESKCAIIERYAHEESELVKSFQHERDAHFDLIKHFSHEVRTQLHSILGLTRREVPDSIMDQAKSRAEIQNECKSLLELTGMMLELLSYDSSKTAETEELSLCNICDEAVSRQLPQLAASSIELSVCYAPDLASVVVGQKSKLEKALTCLTNALMEQHSNGRIDLNLSQHSVTADTIRVDFSLTFEPHNSPTKFTLPTADNHRSTLHRVIAEHLIDQLGGALDIQHDSFGNFCYYFNLPFCVSLCLLPAHRYFNAPGNSLHLTSPNVCDINGLQVLIIDDNAVNQKIAARMIASLNAVPTVADNGETALLLAEVSHYDLILMDCQMPVMDGLETTRRLRKLDDYKDIVIIGITACALPGDRERCFSAGMNAYLSKPFSVVELASTISKLSQKQ